MAGAMGPLRTLWRALGSTRLAAVLLFLLLLASVVYSLFPRIPHDPVVREEWLTLASLRYRGATGLIRFLGLFHGYRAPWLLALLATLALNVLICTLQRLPRLWRALTRVPSVVRPETFLWAAGRKIAAGQAEWPVSSLEQGLSDVCASLRARGRRYRLWIERTERSAPSPAAYVAAERGRWGMTGTALSHVAALALTGVVVAGPALRWQETGIALVPEQTYTTRHGQSLTMQTGTLVEARDATGQATVEHVMLTVAEADSDQGNGQLATRAVRIGQPLKYRGVSFHLQGSGPAMQVISPEGSAVLPTIEGQSQQINLPEAGLVLDIAYQPARELLRGEDPAPLFVQVRTMEGETLGSGYVADGQEIVVEGIPLLFSLSRYTIWQVSHDPTFGFAIGAAGLLLVGIAVSLWVPHRRLWLRIDGRKALMVGAGDIGTFDVLAGAVALNCRHETAPSADSDQGSKPGLEHATTFGERIDG